MIITSLFSYHLLCFLTLLDGGGNPLSVFVSVLFSPNTVMPRFQLPGQNDRGQCIDHRGGRKVFCPSVKMDRGESVKSALAVRMRLNRGLDQWLPTLLSVLHLPDSNFQVSDYSLQ